MITQTPTRSARDHSETVDTHDDSRAFNFSIEEAEVISLFRQLDDCERQGVLEGMRHILRFRPTEVGPDGDWEDGA